MTARRQDQTTTIADGPMTDRHWAALAEHYRCQVPGVCAADRAQRDLDRECDDWGAALAGQPEPPDVQEVAVGPAVLHVGRPARREYGGYFAPGNGEPYPPRRRTWRWRLSRLVARLVYWLPAICVLLVALYAGWPPLP